ncbi:alpha-glucan family phosphorylase [Luteibacter yeojuensis]|uniref:Glycosyltransferase family 1 protein n=1 Tax=Luteibacter yeojuensis TaxID=345309 RepID=A0A7X5QSN8_9GAMM|nr:alpha-glucan family phosphorylase [Luteibacter yeojuensis]NID14624.1 glycosyltransferase family 1 protein [Luteibacter yeojuensis]
MYRTPPRAPPAGLEALTELALDLRWTWNHAVDGLWREVDAELWDATHNPWVVLQNVPQARLEQLSGDTAFRERLAAAAGDRQEYLDAPGLYASLWPGDMPAGVAFFSMEFGLSEALPLYAGGLGVLAGDYLKTASDLGVPMTGIGLLYQEGYFRQTIDATGNQREAFPYNDPASLPIQPSVDTEGVWREVEVPLPGRTLRLRVWQAQVGRATLYLLDGNHVLNGPVDRGVTAKLYGGGTELRLLQELVLGVGGWRLLAMLGKQDAVAHLNEGHAALAVLERARQCMHERSVSFRDAWWATRPGNIFTTHTPVAAGFDAFAPALVEKYAQGLLADCKLSLHDLLALGRADPSNDNEPFNMTYLALRGCAQACAVSRLHGEVSRTLFAGLYPRWPVAEVPVRHVTNGVHVPSWDSAPADTLWTVTCGKSRWRGNLACLEAALVACDDTMLWNLAARQRAELVRYVRERLERQLGLRGEGERDRTAAQGVLDPNVLTLGMARRFAEYKRMNLLLHDPQRLARLLTNPAHPMQLIVAGKAHPDDTEGKRQVQAWVAFARRPEVAGRVVFLEDYDLALAQRLVQGVDVWLNTPRRPWEACGTSGMKTLVNGGLNVSTLDGWWAEAYDDACGWAIAGPGGDAEDAESLYGLLENEIVPCFYERDAHGVPAGWVRRMRASMSRLAPRFSSNRMLLDYLEDFYLPATRGLRRRAQRHELASWAGQVSAHWHEARLGDVEVVLDGHAWRFRAQAYLGGVQLGWVRAELYADERDGMPRQCVPMQGGAPISGAIHGYEFEATLPAIRPASDYTVRLRPWHDDAFLPAELPLVIWQR